MGRKPEVQQKLFYTTFNLDQRVRKDHILRKIAANVNFDYVYKQKDLFLLGGRPTAGKSNNNASQTL